MVARIFFLLLGAIALSSCAEDSDGSSSPRMKQVAHTNPMGQTTYSYEPVDASSQ